MNEKSVLDAMTSTLIFAAGVSLTLHAQTEQPYQESLAELSPSQKSGGRNL
jgi:hypothetical protein